MIAEISGLWVKPCIDRLADWLFRGAGGSVARLALTPWGSFTPIAMTNHIAYIFLVFLLAFTASAGGVDSGIDLLESLQLHNTSRQGVSTIPGPQRLRPAFYLQGDYRDLRLPQSVFQKAVQLLRHNPEFTLSASLRQEVANSGSIISFSHGFNRYLELQSSGRKDEIRLHYTSQMDDIVHVEAFPYRLADNSWHKLAVTVSGSQVELLVDCHPLYRRLLQRTPDTNFTLPQLTLWVGQRNNRHSLFKGVLQDVRLISGPHGYLNQCPQLDAGCPTCGQFTTLQHTVEQLNKRLHLLTDMLLAAEGRITRLEECDCRKSCTVNGTEHQDGASWQIGCDVCRCKMGEVRCQPVQCPKTTCKHPVIKPRECCPTCLKQCYHMKTLYDHGERTSPKACFECKCEDGSMECKQKDPNVICPPLPCPSSQQFSVPGECCKFCPGVDYCGRGHMCHVNATCINLTTTYACHCNNGYQGDGYECHDVDECKLKGGLEGNHCHMNTRCVNTPGSYICECLPGYRRIDKFNCAELDECSTNQHKCDPHADCINTLGSYHCICQNGYSGDGYTCTPICESPCLNGGKCVSPGVCSCRRGYQGANCEQDLDECATDLHGCHPTSTCVNMPGWYYCRCKPGYRSILHEGTLGTTCQDLDECQEGTHTCHPTAKCVNTEGGFQCTCPAVEDTQLEESCSLSCMFEGSEVANNAVVTPAGQPCRSCKCVNGVITCRDTKCDCSKRGASRDRCCPQCDPRAACTHQELRHVVFTSGERWIYQCQTCECLFGEIDCWSLECPPITCSSPVLSPGDCCPRCENDPCALEMFDNSSGLIATQGQPCAVSGRLYHSGSSWGDPEDRCTTCSCKVPLCDLLVSNRAQRTDVCAAVLMCGAVFLAATRLTLSKAGVPTTTVTTTTTSVTQTICSYQNWNMIKGQIKTLARKLAQTVREVHLSSPILVALVQLVKTTAFFPFCRRIKLPPENSSSSTKLRLVIIVVLIITDFLKIYPSIIYQTVLETWKWLIMVLTIKRSQAGVAEPTARTTAVAAANRTRRGKPFRLNTKRT